MSPDRWYGISVWKRRSALQLWLEHALASGIRAAMWLAAGLSLAGALCAALTTGSQPAPERAAA
jgi:hypothetical protein